MKSKDRGGELQSPHTFWGVLLGCLRNASISPQECFFTNAMMGLMPEGATGKMPIEKDFKEQYEYRQLLIKQIDIVMPRTLISLGGEAGRIVAEIRPTIPWHRSMHPSAREFKPLDRREIRITSEGQAIDRFITTSNISRH
jgi:uracil-DNA glycosylase